MSAAALVLAAGAGSRFEGPTHKLLATVGGRPIVQVAVAAPVAAGLPTFVVEGAVQLGPWIDPRAVVVRNERWAEGQATSLQAGIAAIRAGGFDAAVVGLGDQPGVPPGAWRALAEVGAVLAVATYDGRRGQPVRLGAEVWPLLPAAGDEGARSLLRGRPDVVEVPCAGDPGDVDTVADLARWRRA